MPLHNGDVASKVDAFYYFFQTFFSMKVTFLVLNPSLFIENPSSFIFKILLDALTLLESVLEQ